MITGLQSGIVRILGPNRQTVGTGFLISREGLIATCAHIIYQAGAGPGDAVSIALCNAPVSGAQPDMSLARVEPAWWRDPGKEDVAVLRLEQNGEDKIATATSVSPFTLGSSFGVEGQTFSTFGFPAAKPVEGLPGKCEVIGRSTENGYPVLTLRSNEIGSVAKNILATITGIQ